MELERRNLTLVVSISLFAHICPLICLAAIFSSLKRTAVAAFLHLFSIILVERVCVSYPYPGVSSVEDGSCSDDYTAMVLHFMCDVLTLAQRTRWKKSEGALLRLLHHEERMCFSTCLHQCQDTLCLRTFDDTLSAP